MVFHVGHEMASARNALTYKGKIIYSFDDDYLRVADTNVCEIALINKNSDYLKRFTGVLDQPPLNECVFPLPVSTSAIIYAAPENVQSIILKPYNKLAQYIGLDRHINDVPVITILQNICREINVPPLPLHK